MLIVSYLFIFNISFAQDVVKNMPTYDREPWHPGFTLGFNISDFVIRYTPSFAINDSISQITSSSSSGIDLGKIGRAHV